MKKLAITVLLKWWTVPHLLWKCLDTFARIGIDAAVSSRSHHGAAIRLFAAAERGDLRGLYAPTSIATCWYVAHEKEDTDPRGLFRFAADVMDAVPMGRPVLRAALQHETAPDFEDVYLAAAGDAAGASTVVTRNEADFVETPLTPYHPLDLLRMLGP